MRHVVRHIFAVLLLGLLVQNVIADISLKLRDATGRGRAHYLPPTARGADAENIIIKEDYCKVGHTSVQPQTQGNTFEESKYGNSRYQIFEVHNHYGPAPTTTTTATRNTGNRGYLPPPAHEALHMHTNRYAATATNEIDVDDDIGVTVAFPQHIHHQPQQSQHSHRAAPYSAPAAHTIATTQARTLLATSTQSHSHQQRQPTGVPGQPQAYQTGGYLPPQQSSRKLPRQQLIQQPFVPQQQQLVSRPLVKPAYAGPAYLPPAATAQLNTKKKKVAEQPTAAAVAYRASSTSNILAVTRGQVQASTTELRATGQLSPGYDYANSKEQQQQQLQQQHVEQQSVQHQLVVQQKVAQHQQQVNAATAYGGPGYLPPDNGFVRPAEPQPTQATQLQAQEIQVQQQHELQVLPQQQQQQQQQQVQTNIIAESGEYHTPSYLSPGYMYNNAEAQALQPQVQAPIQQQEQQQQFDVNYQLQQQQEITADAPAAIQATLSETGQLPEGYDFTKPDNAEEAIAELHSLQRQTQLAKQQPQLQQQQQQQQHVVQAPFQIAARKPSTGNVYGTPRAEQAPVAVQQTRPGVYRAPSYLSPATSSVAHVDATPQTIPVAPQATTTTYMHPLSSYMTSVQPYARYAASQPQPQLQPQRQQPVTAVPAQNIEVAPMYREAAKRPRHYAPAMSYALPHVTHTQLRPAVKQTLQQLMPKDTLATAAQRYKIRTVQIVAAHAVRTLKVLETFDQAGVKIIKILGPSNEQPHGQHHIVNVVSHNQQTGAEQHVPTVKIYDDHKGVSITSTAAQPDSRGYLPPTATAVRSRRGYLPPTATAVRSRSRTRARSRY